MKPVYYLVFILTFIMTIFIVNTSIAATTVPVQARFFAGETTFKENSLTDTFSAENMSAEAKHSKLGLEALYTLFGSSGGGIRFEKKSTLRHSEADIFKTISANQYALSLIARLAILDTPNIRLDLFGTYGTSYTKLTFNSDNFNGTMINGTEGIYTLDGTSASPYSYGASLGLGAKGYYIYVESGIERNIIKKFKSTGTVPNAITQLDLSGPYVLLGLIIDGFPWKK